MAIIAILAALLLPAIGQARKAAQAANTQAQIGQLASVIQAYYGDFNHYPGPVPNVQLGVAGAPPAGCNITTVANAPASSPAWDVTRMSMAENLYLGLMGGLEPTAVAAITFRFDYQKAGTGARQLSGPSKKFSPYTDNADVSQGGFVDSNGTAANDTVIPEFIDRFPEAMPILYLRARVGAAGVAGDSTATEAIPPRQYDVKQVISYTGSKIGVGRSIKADVYKGYSGAKQPAYGDRPHGFQTAIATARIGPYPITPPPPPQPTDEAGTEFYPYDLYAALVDPSIRRKTEPSAAMPQNSPRQKDGFVLISAGIDRVYGTKDDITNFGSY